jgi:hypothetical protein
MHNLKRKGQSANQAAIVIILIAVMIILYILFLPPEDRAALLGEDLEGQGTGTGAQGRIVLMSKTPGRVYPTGSNTVEHRIPSFLVYTSTNSDELKRSDSVYTRNSAFGSQTGEVIFFYDEATQEDLRLSFNVASASGRLKVTLNGRQIFEGDVAQGSPNPITIPKEYLQEKNTLLFTVSSPGLIFWSSNEYMLESVVISGRVTDYSGSRSEQHFSLSDTEYEKLEKANFNFLPDCPPREDGRLEILMNGRPLYSTVPDCGIPATIEVSKEFLKPGDNTLVATTTQGQFLIDAPKISTFMKDVGQPVFYFTASPQILDAVYSGRRGLLVTIRFADATTPKRGVIEINGFKQSFETTNYLYQAPLDPESLMEGSNGIRMVPISGPMDVVELRVEVI